MAPSDDKTLSSSSSSAAASAADDQRLRLSNTMMVCLIFIVQTFLGAVLFSAWDSDRCLYWNQISCPPDLAWIVNWLSLGHCHVALLLAALAKSVHDRYHIIADYNTGRVGNTFPAVEEVALAYVVAGLLAIHLGVGMTTTATTGPPHINGAFWTVQMGTWAMLLALIAWFTYSEHDEPLRRRVVTPLDLLVASKRQSSSRRLLTTTASDGGGGGGRRCGLQRSSSERILVVTAHTFDANGKIPVTAIALAVVLVGYMVQILDLVLDDKFTASHGFFYEGPTTSVERYQSAYNMALASKWTVALVLAATLRFFDLQAQRSVLLAHVMALMIVEVMLAGSPGEAMVSESKQSLSVGTFFMILTSILGAV